MSDRTADPVVLERIVKFGPAWHRVHEDPKQNYGVHGVELRMLLRGPLGATQFLLYTGWFLPQTLEWWKSRGIGHDCRPTPADRGYHWSVPLYGDQTRRECDLLPGGYCYYDGSSLNADDTYKELLEKGDAGVWADLEAYYHELSKERADAA